MRPIGDPMHPQTEPAPLRNAPRCGARTRSGQSCRSPAVKGRARCRMHGGAKGTGGRPGAQRQLSDGPLHEGKYGSDAVSPQIAARVRSSSCVFNSTSELDPLLTRAAAFVPVERSLRPRVALFAPLRDKVTSSAQLLAPAFRRLSQGSSLSILTEPHDELAPVHSITTSAAIRRTEFMERPGGITPA
jgi:glucans biosynthesis protein